MMKVTVGHITVEASNFADFNAAIGLIDALASKARETLDCVSVANDKRAYVKREVNPSADDTDWCAVWVGSELNTLGKERFRSTSEEKASGKDARRCAKERLMHAGLVEHDAQFISEQGESESVTFHGEIDPSGFSADDED